MLPYIRGLKDLRISFITTKRAYEELEKEGFIYTLPGKGCYVAPKNIVLLREKNLKKIEEYIDEVVFLVASKVIPAGIRVRPISIEELFVFMVKD